MKCNAFCNHIWKKTYQAIPCQDIHMSSNMLIKNEVGERLSSNSFCDLDDFVGHLVDKGLVEKG